MKNYTGIPLMKRTSRMCHVGQVIQVYMYVCEGWMPLAETCTSTFSQILQCNDYKEVKSGRQWSPV